MSPVPIRPITVIQGEYRVGRGEDEVLTTVLGSCVACCLHDPARGIGGMNHFLLPDEGGGQGGPARYGLQAMELLINALLRFGARKDDLVAKLFGGARMRDGLGGVGASNAAFAQRFLVGEGITCLKSSLGGTRARRVRFWPGTGRAQMRLLDQTVPKPVPKASPLQSGGDVTFF